MRDVELLLRSFSLLIDNAAYQPPMSRFLDKFSAKAKKEFSSSDITLIESIFRSFLNAISALPPGSFLSESGRFSIALFEATIFGLCKQMWERKEVLSLPPIDLDELKKLGSDPDFKKYLQEGTTKQINVSERLKAAMRVLAAHN